MIVAPFLKELKSYIFASNYQNPLQDFLELVESVHLVRLMSVCTCTSLQVLSCANVCELKSYIDNYMIS